MRIGIVGAGHAGIEAARAAREAGTDVIVFSAEGVLPYFRPRLVAYAFGHADLPSIQMHPAEWYPQQGLELRLDAAVERIDPPRLEITAQGRSEAFDGLVLASGATPIVPPFAANAPSAILPLWSVAHADAIRRRVRRGDCIVIVGGGILGIEAALRALDAGMQVTIVELMDRLMPAQFGTRASTVLLRRLHQKGIAVRLGRAVKRALPLTHDRVGLQLDDGEELPANVCLVSIGARPATALPRHAGLQVERGLVVDPTLRTSCAGCFAAGDAIQFQGLTRCSVREAGSQGRIAGANAAASVKGQPLRAYQPESQPLMFRSGDFELYAVGQPGGVGYEEHLLDGTTESVLRSLIVKDGIPLGVQMIGTREGFDQYAVQVRGQAGLRTI
jgi:NAD(P)H-nitrite reductase large subunit